MKPIITSLLILATSMVAQARAVRNWSDQELFDKSDLVIIATPTASADTRERTNLPGFDSQHVIGVETRFAVSSVVKGDKALKNFVLHHYRVDGPTVPNGPVLVSFKPQEKRTYRLYLIKEADGRYAPTVGQVDPGMQGIAALVDPVNTAPDATVLVRLVKVTRSPDHAPTIIATFEPIRINLPEGGGQSAVASVPPETVIGKQFNAIFNPGIMRDLHQRTLCNVIQSCRGEPKEDPSALKLHLVLSIPEKASKELSNGFSDFSQWVIESIGLPK